MAAAVDLLTGKAEVFDARENVVAFASVSGDGYDDLSGEVHVAGAEAVSFTELGWPEPESRFVVG